MCPAKGFPLFIIIIITIFGGGEIWSAIHSPLWRPVYSRLFYETYDNPDASAVAVDLPYSWRLSSLRKTDHSAKSAFSSLFWKSRETSHASGEHTQTHALRKFARWLSL